MRCSRTGRAWRTADTSADSAEARRWAGMSDSSSRPRTTSSNTARSSEERSASSAARRNRAAPSASISSTSTPAAILTVAACFHVPTGSSQPSTTNWCRPGSAGRSVATTSSRPGRPGRICTRCTSAPAGSSRRTVARTESWPSRNTVARTGMSSPTTAFAGNRPSSTTGCTSVTGMRPVTVWRRTSAAVALWVSGFTVLTPRRYPAAAPVRTAGPPARRGAEGRAGDGAPDGTLRTAWSCRPRRRP